MLTRSQAFAQIRARSAPRPEELPQGKRRQSSARSGTSTTYSADQYQSYGSSRFAQGEEKEKSRLAAVIGSTASTGRERTALELLAYTKDSASTIIAKLNALPSDAELDQRRKANAEARKREENAKIWKAAYRNASKMRNGPMSSAMRDLRKQREGTR